MNKITHGIFLIFMLFQMLCSNEVDAQYLNSNSKKMPLSFVSSQYWQNYNSTVCDSIEIDKSNWIPRVGHKFAFGLLIGGGGAFLSTYLSNELIPIYGPIFFGPISYALFSSMGVKLASNNYENETHFGILLLAGFSGMAIGSGLGFLFEEITEKDTYNVPALVGAILGGLLGEIWASELDYSKTDDSDWDRYIYNETDKLAFHEYFKTTQLVYFEVLRIDF